MKKLVNRINPETGQRESLYVDMTQEEIDARIAKENRLPPASVEAVKEYAGQLIVKFLPMWKQNNLTARATELSDIKHSRALTVDEVAEEIQIRNAWDVVKAIRAKSDEIEAMSPIPDDFRNASYGWPTVT